MGNILHAWKAQHALSDAKTLYCQLQLDKVGIEKTCSKNGPYCTQSNMLFDGSYSCTFCGPTGDVGPTGNPKVDSGIDPTFFDDLFRR